MSLFFSDQNVKKILTKSFEKMSMNFINYQIISEDHEDYKKIKLFLLFLISEFT